MTSATRQPGLKDPPDTGPTGHRRLLLVVLLAGVGLALLALAGAAVSFTLGRGADGEVLEPVPSPAARGPEQRACVAGLTGLLATDVRRAVRGLPLEGMDAIVARHGEGSVEAEIYRHAGLAVIQELEAGDGVTLQRVFTAGDEVVVRECVARKPGR